MVNITLFQSFIHPRWCRISSINNRSFLITLVDDYEYGNEHYSLCSATQMAPHCYKIRFAKTIEKVCASKNMQLLQKPMKGQIVPPPATSPHKICCKSQNKHVSNLFSIWLRGKQDQISLVLVDVEHLCMLFRESCLQPGQTRWTINARGLRATKSHLRCICIFRR